MEPQDIEENIEHLHKFSEKMSSELNNLKQNSFFKPAGVRSVNGIHPNGIGDVSVATAYPYGMQEIVNMALWYNAFKVSLIKEIKWQILMLV
jgi:hypothetical protein